MRAVAVTRYLMSLSPVVGEAFPSRRAGDALTLIRERRNVAKVVLVP